MTSTPQQELLSWAAQLVRLVCFGDLERDFEGKIAEPIRDIAMQMKQRALAGATPEAASLLREQIIEKLPKYRNMFGRVTVALDDVLALFDATETTPQETCGHARGAYICDREQGHEGNHSVRGFTNWQR